MKKWKTCRWSLMLRPIVYRVLLKCSVFFIIWRLWDLQCNAYELPISNDYVPSIFAIVFFAAAWFSFLRLDGVRLPRLPKRQKGKKRSMQLGDIVDYTDTELTSFDELEDYERDICSLISSLACGFILILFALF